MWPRLQGLGMTDSASSQEFYRPSVIELAQAGNCRAIAYWMNSLLASQGVHISVRPAEARYFLKIFVDFQQFTPRETCLGLRDRLVRFICYRLWTLNSETIFGVYIVARIVGSSKILWQQSVRINTPASSQRIRYMQAARAQRQGSSFSFQFFRSLLLSSVTLAGFYLGYRLFYVQLSRALSQSLAPQPLATLTRVPESYLALIQTAESRRNSAVQSIPSMVSVPESFRGTVTTHVSLAQGEKAIALTFDDGPWPDTTERVLDILDQHGVKATFFMVGLQVRQYPALAKQVAEAGHAIGNHTIDHPLQQVSLADAAYQIDGMEKLIYETTGVKAELFRPPGGQFDELADYAQERNYATTLWSVDSEDYYVSSPVLLNNVLKKVQPGGIVLMHDGGGNRSATVRALPQLISALKRQGYRFATVPELMTMQARET